jgi:hypothetical protein
MALGSTQPLTEMSTSNLPGGKGWPGRKVSNLTAICESTVQKMWKSQCLTTLWASKACLQGLCYLFYNNNRIEVLIAIFLAISESDE